MFVGGVWTLVRSFDMHVLAELRRLLALGGRLVILLLRDVASAPDGGPGQIQLNAWATQDQDEVDIDSLLGVQGFERIGSVSVAYVPWLRLFASQSCPPSHSMSRRKRAKCLALLAVRRPPSVCWTRGPLWQCKEQMQRRRGLNECHH